MGLKEDFEVKAEERESHKAKCSTCDFFDGPYIYNDTPKDEESDASNHYGFCQCCPPQPLWIDLKTGDINHGWPEGKSDGWCGQHKPRQPEDVPLEIHMVDTNLA